MVFGTLRVFWNLMSVVIWALFLPVQIPLATCQFYSWDCRSRACSKFSCVIWPQYAVFCSQVRNALNFTSTRRSFLLPNSLMVWRTPQGLCLYIIQMGKILWKLEKPLQQGLEPFLTISINIMNNLNRIFFKFPANFDYYNEPPIVCSDPVDS